MSVSLINDCEMLFVLQEEIERLDGVFIEFQTQIMKVKDWLAEAETLIAAHDKLTEQQKATITERERIKVSWLYLNSACCQNKMLSKFSFRKKCFPVLFLE